MFKIFIGALFGGIVGAAFVWFIQTGSFHLVSLNMSYADLAAIMLSAVSVLVTVLGVFIAALAIWGYSQFRSIAQSAAKSHVGSELKDGELKTHIEKIIGDFLSTELKAGSLRKLMEERVDHILFSGAAQRAEEEADEEEEALGGSPATKNPPSGHGGA